MSEVLSLSGSRASCAVSRCETVSVERRDTLEAARAKFGDHEWSEAYELLTAADRSSPLDADDLERLAHAARWSRHYAEMFDAFERAEAAYDSVGDHRGAARIALQLAREHYERGRDAVASGWFGRAATRLGDDTECGEFAMLQLQSGVVTFLAGDFENARRLLTNAAEIARRVGHRDAEGLAGIYLGHVLVNLGDHVQGLAMVDEATAAAMGGALSVHAAGTIYCSTIYLCRNRGDWRRAQEWTDASMRWSERESMAVFPGLCHFHRAEVMRLRGDLDEAERDVLEAIEELMIPAPRFTGVAFHELGEIRRRRGNLASAAAAFKRAAELGFDPQPGLALMRLDQGDVAGAHAGIRRALADDDGLVQESLGLVLPAAVTIALAAGDLEAAYSALGRLEVRASASGTTAFAAALAGARGEVALAEGRTGDAVGELRAACRLWVEVGAPYETAQTRVVLAQAFRDEGSGADAELELEAALTAFERLGAQHQARRVSAMLSRRTGGTRRVLTFVFTDIMDSTRLVELLGDEAWDDLVGWHDRTLRALFTDFGGDEVDHAGDGFFVAFRDADAAFDCARAVQRTLSEHRRAHGFGPRVRIGIHTAEANERGGDYIGKGVHAAARVGGASRGNEILASRAALDASRGDVAISEPRTLELKGLADPLEVVTVDW